MKTKTNGLRDYLKANRRASREAEIGNHDRPVSFSRVHKSKKVYDRKKLRADDKRHLPSSFPCGGRQSFSYSYFLKLITMMFTLIFTKENNYGNLTIVCFDLVKILLSAFMLSLLSL